MAALDRDRQAHDRYAGQPQSPGAKSPRGAKPNGADPAPRSFDAADLMVMTMAEPNFVAGCFVPEGVTLWCGRPKLGKTTALRQLALAVNTGEAFLGESCSPAEVWFLSLEEGERLARQKLRAMAPDAHKWRGIRLEFAWPQGAEGVEQLRQRLLARADARPVLVIVDSLTRFRFPPTDRGHAFTEDYNATKLLAELCKEFPGLAIVILHHTTKALPDDPVSCISGTYGLSAAIDSYCVMLKHGERFRLHAGGRLWDRDVCDFELTRSDGRWHLAGTWNPAAGEAIAPKQQQVLDLLKGGAKSGRELAQLTGQSQSALSHLMGKLAARGFVVRIANGWGLS